MGEKTGLAYRVLWSKPVTSVTTNTWSPEGRRRPEDRPQRPPLPSLFVSDPEDRSTPRSSGPLSTASPVPRSPPAAAPYSAPRTPRPHACVRGLAAVWPPALDHVPV